MNQLKLLFALSVALNVGLITLLALYIASSPGPQAGRPQQTSIEQAAGEAIIDADEAHEIGDPSLEGDSAPASAQTYRRLFSALRATGLPEAEIHRILRGAALADWHHDIRQLRAEETQRGFWESPSDVEEVDLVRQMIEMGRARERALAEVIGDRAAFLPDGPETDRNWTGISPEKQRRVRMLEEDYALLMTEIQAASDGVLLSEDIEALQLLHQERREDLAAILTADELEEYELRNSDIARELRRDLRFFSPTEQEFRAIFQLRRELESAVPAGAGDQRQQAERSEALARNLRDLLGEERFAEYRRASDSEFQQLASIVNRLDLSLDRAIRVHNFKALVDEQSLAIQTDTGLNAEEREEALRWLADEAEQVVRDALGEDGYEIYLQNSGWWLRSLQTQVSSAAPAEREEEIPADAP